MIFKAFYDIWDKVVGHSYWPDMIDGVIGYTMNLFSAEGMITRFAPAVKDEFKNLYYAVTEVGSGPKYHSNGCIESTNNRPYRSS